MESSDGHLQVSALHEASVFVPTKACDPGAVDVACVYQLLQESGLLFQVLEYCDMHTRGQCMCVCKRFHDLLSTKEAFIWRLERLHIEHGIYYPRSGSLEEKSDDVEVNDTNDRYDRAYWKSLYESLHAIRQMWEKEPVEKEGQLRQEFSKARDESTNANNPHNGIEETFQINVCVRFKPNKPEQLQHDAETSKNAFLPLHQRLALVRLSYNIESQNDALKVLKDNGEWFQEKWKAEGDTRKRARVQNSDSMKENQSISCGIQTVDTSSNRVVIADATKGLREFEFDHVLEYSSTQEHVYNLAAKKLVCDFINGFNATCLVYGQTGSGKTYTMFGQHFIDNSESNENKFETSFDSHAPGIVPQALAEIFDANEYRRHHTNLHIVSSISISYIEIYGNQITDLLKEGSMCGHSKVAAQRYVLSGALEVPVRDLNEVMNLLHKGENQKRTACTAMNQKSSRAHSIFIVKLNQKCGKTGVEATSKLFLADLGGSEQTKKSKIASGKSNFYEDLKKRTMGKGTLLDSEIKETSMTKIGNDEDNNKAFENNEYSEYSTGFTQSDRMREAVYINLGLLALKQCVKSLRNDKSSHVPYSNSKLTMLLSSGLGGNCKTSVIVCASQESENTTETISALRFGEDCRHIAKSATARNTTTMMKDLLSSLDDEISRCERRISEKERWELREDRILDKHSSNPEMHKTAVLVGAEDERKNLNILLQKRAKVLGIKFDERELSNDCHKFGRNLGFGNAHAYGLGDKFMAHIDNAENYRFRDYIDEKEAPLAVKARGETRVGWKSGNEIYEDPDRLSKRAKKVDRNKLVYSGISA